MDVGSKGQQAPSPTSRAEVVKAGEVTGTLPDGKPPDNLPRGTCTGPGARGA